MHIHGGDIYTAPYRLDFSANLNPLGMPRSVADAAREGVGLSDHYPDVQCRGLRAALSEREHVPTEHIICGNGAAELIFLLAGAVSPKTALLVSPGFAEYEQALPEGCTAVFYPLSEEKGFALGEDYLDYLEQKPDLAFLCNPNNPTGVLVPRPLLERIVQTCEQNGTYLLLDVCFMDFLDNPAQTDFSSALEEHPHLFLLKAFTKTYAMAGLRLGYGLSADRALLSRMERGRQPWSVSVPAQMAGVAALREEAYVDEARALVQKERAWLSKMLCGLGFTVYASAANFLFFHGPEGLAQKCAERGVLIRDCANYRGLSDGYYRVAVRARQENEELARVLKECVTWQR